MSCRPYHPNPPRKAPRPGRVRGYSHINPDELPTSGGPRRGARRQTKQAIDSVPEKEDDDEESEYEEVEEEVSVTEVDEDDNHDIGDADEEAPSALPVPREKAPRPGRVRGYSHINPDDLPSGERRGGRKGKMTTTSAPAGDGSRSSPAISARSNPSDIAAEKSASTSPGKDGFLKKTPGPSDVPARSQSSSAASTAAQKDVMRHVTPRSQSSAARSTASPDVATMNKKKKPPKSRRARRPSKILLYSLDEANRKREKCWMWYARLGQPDYKRMKTLVAGMPPSCEITEDDVDLLPWVWGGRACDVHGMNKLITEDFHEILGRVKSTREEENTSDDSSG